MTPESLEGLSGPEAAAKALEWVLSGDRMPHPIRAKAAELRAHKTLAQEPVAFLFQHGDTGFTQSIPPHEVDDFVRLNPRWIEVGPLYTRPAAMAEALGLLREAESWVDCSHPHWDAKEPGTLEKLHARIAAFLKAHGGEHE